MKKILLVLLMAAMFVGCGYEFQKKEDSKTNLIMTKEFGNIQVEGDIVFIGGTHGAVKYKTKEGKDIVLKNWVAIQYDFVAPSPQAQQPVQPPAPKPEKTEPVQKE